MPSSRAVVAAEAAYGPEAGTDPYRGLVIGADEVTRLLDRAPGEPVLASPTHGDAINDLGRELAWLGHAFELNPFDIDVLLVAIAPELDLRYERLYGYLQDDVTRRRPSVDLVCNLLCHSARDRLEARARFAPDAPLVASGLVELLDDPNQRHAPLLARALKPDDQVVRLLIGEATLDRRLAPSARIERAFFELSDLPLEPETRRALPVVTTTADALRLRLAFHGPRDAGQHATAIALAAEAGMRLLAVDLERALDAGSPVDEVVAVAFREARFHGERDSRDGCRTRLR